MRRQSNRPESHRCCAFYSPWPSSCGTRFWDYSAAHRSNAPGDVAETRGEEDALYDVLRLSRGMSFKNAMAGLRLGGGKS
ncbi:MAG: hypothetical protein JKY57_00630, partial [Kordiimonadaceae bacterium]|nr:hypothetical protein [Kordiimonadaceae bacterium]